MSSTSRSARRSSPPRSIVGTIATMAPACDSQCDTDCSRNCSFLPRKPSSLGTWCSSRGEMAIRGNPCAHAGRLIRVNGLSSLPATIAADPGALPQAPIRTPLRGSQEERKLARLPRVLERQRRDPMGARGNAPGGRDPMGARGNAPGGRDPMGARGNAPGGRDPMGARGNAPGGCVISVSADTNPSPCPRTLPRRGRRFRLESGAGGW